MRSLAPRTTAVLRPPASDVRHVHRTAQATRTRFSIGGKESRRTASFFHITWAGAWDFVFWEFPSRRQGKDSNGMTAEWNATAALHGVQRLA